MIPAAPAMTEATTTAVTARRAAFPAELLDRIPFFMIFLSLLTLLVLETPMTRIHSRPEATELRSCWEWLLCTDDGELEAATRPRYELVGEPDRSLGLARNDDLVGWECQEGVLDRLQRIGVTDATPCVDAAAFETIEPRGYSFLRPAASGVFVRHPAAEPRVQCRSQDEDVGVRKRSWDRGVQGDHEHVRFLRLGTPVLRASVR
jgi:hypothetical protein